MKGSRGYLYFLVFVFVLSFLAIISDGKYGGDGLENYLTAESIVLNHNLSIYDKPFDVKEMKYEVRGNVDAAGKRYSTFGIGMPLLLVPFYFVGHILSKFISSVPHDYIAQFVVSFSNPIIIALTAVAIFHLLLELGFSRAVSFLTVISYGLCTMSPVYARSGFSEPVIGLMVVLALIFLRRYEEKGSLFDITIVASLTGYAILVKNNSLLYLPLLLAYLIYKSLSSGPLRKKLELWLSVCIPLAVSIILYMYFHHLMGGFAAGKSNAYKDVVERAIPERFQMLKGLAYYICSTGKGYFFYNLPLLLALFGIGGLLKRHRKFSLAIISIILVNLFFYSFRFDRGSIFSWGPRYLYPTIPLMCIFLAEFIESSRTFGRRMLTNVFLVGGFLVQLPSLCINFSNFILFVKERLGLQEYLINYIPDLSPIRGAWSLFVSAITRMANGRSLDFIYNPDSLFFVPVKNSLEGYDTLDIWFVNVTRVSDKLTPLLIAAVLVLVSVFLISWIQLRIQTKGNIRVKGR